MTLYDWLTSIGVSREDILVVNLVTAGFSTKKGKLVGAVAGTLGQVPDMILEAGCTKEQIDALQPYSGIDWDTYMDLADVPARAQRKLIDILQRRQYAVVLSYSVSRFFQPWLLVNSWTQPLLEYPALDFQDLVAGIDNNAVANYLRAATVGEFAEWLHAAAPGNVRGYGMEALLQRYGCSNLEQPALLECQKRNAQLGYAFLQVAGIPLC